MARLVTGSEFARLVGLTEATVLRAMRTGRLTSADQDDNGRRLLDPVKAAEQWIATLKQPDSRNTGVYEYLRKVKDPPAGEPPPKMNTAAKRKREASQPQGIPMDILDSRSLKEEYAAKREQLRFEKESGKLVEVDLVIRRMTSLAATVRTKMLAIPSRAKLKLQQLTMEDIEVLEGLVREALEELTNINMEELEDGGIDSSGETAD